MSSAVNNSSRSNQRPSQTANPGVGAKYEVRVATLVAAILSTNAQIENYQIFTNLEEALPFDDVVAKVYFKGESTPHALIMQVKHLLKGEQLNVKKYLSGYSNIVRAGGLQTIGYINVNNIHFCYFSVNNVRTPKEYKLLAHNSTNEWWRLAFPFEHCQKLDFRRNINETDNKERKDFLDKFCLYFYQPGMDLIEERIKEICKISDAADILKYVDRFFEKDELWGKGLSKAVFETELLKIRLSDYILSPEDAIQLNDLPVAIWNQLTLLHDVTIVEDEANIGKCLYGCLTQMLNRLLNNVVEWNEHERKKLNSTVISKFKEFFTGIEPAMVRHWISPPTTLKELIIELWKCGELPLILKTEEELSVLKDYAHLKKKYMIITKKLVIRREEIGRFPLNVFTRISDANKCLKVRDELLRAISVSIHGRKPITLYSMVNGHEELTTTLSCAHILHLMKTRGAYLTKECLDVEHDMIFLINDPNCTAEYSADSINKIRGNTAIRCRPDEIIKYCKEIEKTPKLEGYAVYHCVASSENESFTLIEGDKMLLRDYFVDQYGASVYNLESDIVPILGNNFQSIQQDYIPRFLCNAIVSKSLFDSPTTGICFFSGDLTRLTADIKKHILELSLDAIEEKMQISTKNHFIKVKSEDIDNFWKRASKLKRPLLHIRVEGSDMQLSKCKNWNGLSNHISFSGQKISEKRVLTELTEGITVLTGEPGMGKSCLLRSLFKNHGLEKYILFYNLTDYKVKRKNKLQDINSSLDFIVNKVQDARYSEFLSNLFKRKEKLLVVLDSFDEVLPSHKEDILNFIRNLAENNIQIIIASRLIANYILMDYFEVNVFKVDVLNEQNRKEYISNCKLGEEMLTTIPPEFLENPLYLNLLKLIFLKNGHLPDINKFAIFENIMHIKLNQYFEKYYSDDHKSDKGYLLDYVLEKHFKLALVRIVGVDVVEKLLGWTCEDQLSNQMKLGIILSIDEDCYPTFVHETFAEYLTAAWIVRNKKKDSAKKVYMEVLNQNKLYVLDILCDHMQLHKAVLESNHEKVKIYSKSRLDLEKTDVIGRTALHVCAARFQMHGVAVQLIICEMLRFKVNYTGSDDVMEWDWVQHTNRGNVIDYELGIGPSKSVAVMEAYANCIVQKLCAGVELSIVNRPYFDALEIYQRVIKECSGNLIRDLFFIEDAALNGVPQASMHRECQASETDELNFKMISGLTVLHIACIYGNVGAVSTLINIKHDINVTDNFGCTPLHYSVLNSPPVSVNMTKILIENRAKIDVANRWEDIAIYIAVRSRNIDLVKLLLQKVHTLPNREKEVVPLCLFLALEKGDRNMIELLLKYQLHANIVNKAYLSALLFFSIIQTYGLYEYKIYEKDETCPSLSAKKSHLDCMKLLLEYGANANDTLELTILSHIWTPATAELTKEYELVLAYTKKSAAECQTPLMLASAGGSSDLVMLLLEKGASVNSTTIDGKTALMFASERNCLDVAKLLLEKNASVDTATVNGETALMFASRRNSSDVAKLLLEKDASIDTATVNGETALMLASEENSFDVAKLLLEKNASIDTTRTDGETALMLALECNGIKIAKLLIDRGASVNSTTGFGKTPLMCAAKIDSLDMTKLLIEKGASVNSTTVFGETPLIFASTKYSSDVAKLLIEKGADINSTTINGKTALMMASGTLGSTVAILLIQAGANIHTTTAENETALTFASEKCNLEITTLLLALGADVNSTTRDGRMPLMLATKYGRVNFLKLLLEKGAHVNSTTIHGRTPLMFALENNNLDAAKLLIERGASVNSTATDGTTPLMLAANLPMLEDEEVAEDYSTIIDILAALKGPFKSYNLPMLPLIEGTHINSAEHDAARLLPENGAAVNSTANGEIPLTLATRCNRADVVKLLLEKGADMNTTTSDEKTPLMFTCETGRLDVAQLLLEKGTDVNTATESGKTALIFSIQEGQYSATELLLMNGADVNHITKRGRTPLFFAIRRPDAKITKLLLQRGANVNSTTSKGETPLFYMLKWCPIKSISLELEAFMDVKASERYDGTRSYYDIERDRVKVVKLLLEYGADVNRSTRYGRTPLYYAIVEDRVNNVKLLLEHGADVNRPVRRDGTTPLDFAVKLNREKIVDLLLEYGAENSKTKRGSLPRVKASILRRSRYFGKMY